MNSDQDILNVLKYNQDRIKDLNRTALERKKSLYDTIKTSQNFNRDIDIQVSKSLNVIKKHGKEVNKKEEEISINKSSQKRKESTYEQQSWNELVNEARESGYETTQFEDVLSPEEFSKADGRYMEIEKKFRSNTKLNKFDITFLFIATALQCAGQYILSNEKFRFKTAAEADKHLKTPFQKRLPKEWQDILLGSVPYDAVAREDINSDSTGLGPMTHRYRTLGHDPILGWIFGPVNILSDSLTKTDFVTTYEVHNGKIGGYYSNGTFGAINCAIEVAQENKYNLPAAVIKQALHFGTDYFTKQGLPLSFISSIDNDLSQTLIQKYSIDSYSVTRGSTVSILINSIIGLIHQLFYDETKYGSREMYEVKTRKILLLSNSLATTSNVIYVALSKDLKKLDAGGMLVTFHRLVSDLSFISKVKEEFIYSKLDADLQQELDEINSRLDVYEG